MQTEVAPSDKETMLATLSDTPSITMLFAGSDDQRAEVWKIKERHLFLRDKLAAYFSGQADLNIEGLNQFDQESLELEKDKLLAFYALTQGSWGDLIALSESAGVFFSDAGIYQPGDLLAALIEASAADAVDRILSPYFRFTPSASRKQIKKLKDVAKLLGNRTYSQLRAPEKRKVDQMTAQIEKDALKSRSELPYNFIMNCCRKLANKSSQHSAIRRRLETYNNICSRYMALTNSQLHPRKGIRGWEMLKGHKQYMGTSGGIASA